MNMPLQAQALGGLAALGNARQVVLVQGDDARNALVEVTGRPCVSWYGGVQSVKHTDWTPLAKRNVVIWPDASGDSVVAANAIAKIVASLDATPRVLRIALDGIDAKPEGWNAAAAVAEGMTKANLDDYMRATVGPWVPATTGRSQEASGVQEHREGQREGVSDATFKRLDTVKASARIPHCLNRNDPMPSARALVGDKYTTGGQRLLQHYRGSFYQWIGSAYRDFDRDAVNSMIWLFLEKALHVTTTETFPFQPNDGRVKNVNSALAATCNLPAHVEAPAWLSDDGDMPPAREFLSVANGLLHLPSSDLYPPTPNYFALSSAGTSFLPSTPEPVEWLRFLNQVWGDDAQSIETLQDLFGYLLSSDTSHQKIGLIVGPKRSGKGTIATVLRALLGQDSVAAPTLASLATNFGLAPLIGKSLAVIGDARLSGKADQAAIAERLLSISGEDSITVDRKFLPAWTGRLGVRFLIMSNELPRLADASGALSSRFIVLTMDRSFYGKEDRGLSNRLLGELPAILNWALDGYRRLRERGYFEQPASARDAIDELEALGSPVAAFVKERCTVAAGLQCTVPTLFAEWQDWCEANGRKEAGTAATFGRDVRAVVPGLRAKQRRGDEGRVRVYEGIGIGIETTEKNVKADDAW